MSTGRNWSSNYTKIKDENFSALNNDLILFDGKIRYFTNKNLLSLSLYIKNKKRI
jgi:hypothetical protein